MITVFHIGAFLVYDNEIVEKADTRVVVQADKPNILAALDIAQDIAEYRVAGDYAYFSQFGNNYVRAYPLDGGCGIALKDYLKNNDEDTICNWDEVCDFVFEYDDLDDHTQGSVLNNLRDKSENYFLDWDAEIEDWCNQMLDFNGVEIDKKHCFFSIGYVQRDYGECDWTVTDAAKFFGDGYEKQFKKLSKRLLYRYLVKNNKIEISVKNTRNGYDTNVCLDFPYDYNQDGGGYSESFWNLAEDLQEDIENMLNDIAYDYNRELYIHMRNVLEGYREDSAVEEYIYANDIVFDIDGNIID